MRHEVVTSGSIFRQLYGSLPGINYPDAKSVRQTGLPEEY
jgi:hypothetical protein